MQISALHNSGRTKWTYRVSKPQAQCERYDGNFPRVISYSHNVSWVVVNFQVVMRFGYELCFEWVVYIRWSQLDMSLFRSPSFRPYFTIIMSNVTTPIDKLCLQSLESISNEK